MSVKRILVLGGDVRIVTVANCFNQEGYEVSAYGFCDDIDFDSGIVRVNSLEEGLKYAELVITGLPMSNDDKTINTPLSAQKIYIENVVRNMNKEQIFMGGKITVKIRDLFKMYNIKLYDYLDREDLTVLNAIPTAEGAIEIAMREKDITVHGSYSLVLGFGRIGKILAKDLKALGAKTYVEARKFSDISWIKAYGYESIYLPRLKEQLPKFDVIYNTIPYSVITKDMMKYIKKDCLIIDLASMPGGIDFAEAKRMGIRTIHALSLPGKSSPKTAGEMITETVHNILYDMGV